MRAAELLWDLAAGAMGFPAGESGTPVGKKDRGARTALFGELYANHVQWMASHGCVDSGADSDPSGGGATCARSPDRGHACSDAASLI